MATLNGRDVDSTFKNLLQIDNSNAGVDSTLRTVEDGEGTASALQLSTTGVKFTGTVAYGTNTFALSGGHSLIFTLTGDTNITLPTSGTLGAAYTNVLAGATVSQNSGGAVTGDGTAWTIVCDTALINLNTEYNTTTGVFTPSRTGYYLVTASIEIGAFESDNTYWEWYLLNSNGLKYFLAFDENLPAPGTGTGLNHYTGKTGCAYIKMNLGETLTMVAVVQGHATKNVVITGGATFGGVTRIGIVSMA